MVHIRFLTASGIPYDVEVAPGETVMDAALDHGVPGIAAQCGGGCTCCTCHCYLRADQAQWFPAPVQDELDLLEYAWQRRETSRLSCQLRLTEAMDGLCVEVPAQQA